VKGEVYLLFAFHDYYPDGGGNDLAIEPFAADDDQRAIVHAERAREAHADRTADNWELVAVSQGAWREVASWVKPAGLLKGEPGAWRTP
jgi:hypothetical protein